MLHCLVKLQPAALVCAPSKLHNMAPCKVEGPQPAGDQSTTWTASYPVLSLMDGAQVGEEQLIGLTRQPPAGGGGTRLAVCGRVVDVTVPLLSKIWHQSFTLLRAAVKKTPATFQLPW